MKKTIILLLCCGVLVSMVGCGGNTALPPTESTPITVSETETPTVMFGTYDEDAEEDIPA